MHQQYQNDRSRPSTAGRPSADPEPSRNAGAYGSSITSTASQEQPSNFANEEIMSPSGFFDQLNAAAALKPTPLPTDRVTQQDNSRDIGAPAAPRYRPGLGPMMGSKTDVAAKPVTATPAKSGFKPRAGGAGERLLRRRVSDDAESTLKVVTPPVSQSARQDEITTPITPVVHEPVSPLESPEPPQKVAPTPAPLVTQNLEGVPAGNSVPQEDRSRSPEAARKRDSLKAKPRSNIVAKSLAALNIDPYFLGDRELDYELILSEFGWEQNILDSKQVDTLQASLRREIARLEAGSWTGHPEQKDERIAQVGKLLDRAISECDTMDSLLRLYSVELSVSPHAQQRGQPC